MPFFALATLGPAGLILLAALLGGPFGWLALGMMTALVFVIDRVAAAPRNTDPQAEFPAAVPLLWLLGLGHFALLGATLWALAGENGHGLSERASSALAAALFFGQVSHPAAHELIHRQARASRLLGRLIYCSLLFGHHASAHLRIHHSHVGTDADPASARRGEGFWRYAPRAWGGGFLAGLRAETRLRRGAGGPPWRHPYTLYLGSAAGVVLLGTAWLGGAGLAALLFLALYAQLQILLSDYVQHYGLRRARLADGRPEPVGPRHSWNAPRPASSAMMLNAPRHSDHHVTPARAYPALQVHAAKMPTLPHALPVMAVLALYPPLWRRVMDPLCDRWRPRCTSPAPAVRRHLPSGALRCANAGGAIAEHLPDFAHVDTRLPSRPDPRRPRRARPADDDSGGI